MRAMPAIAALCGACRSADTFGQRIATVPRPVVSLVATQSKIYGRAYASDVYEIAPTGGSRTVLSPSSVSMLLAAAGNQIFFPLSGPVNGGIGAYDVLSATQHAVVPVAVGVTELLADADRIFWVDINSSGGSTVHAIGADGTGAVLLGTGRGIFEDDQALYWTSGGNIIRAPKADLS